MQRKVRFAIVSIVLLVLGLLIGPAGAQEAPLYVAQKMQGNRFQIAGGEPGLEVSWQVTGIRHDAYADAHRIPVEEPKPAEERGLYLHPVELGQPAELRLDRN